MYYWWLRRDSGEAAKKTATVKSVEPQGQGNYRKYISQTGRRVNGWGAETIAL